ncbi:hypothetical protein [Conexibacter sp. DBS9H8]|uniref:hypothetical protein n=1 Tax=Conexibacter sp. DBS9H8 TaxID=2937801 RepID=UPI00200FB5D7|nr:hypothetical protein [Conexibacter sp. DBS9H8]
MPLLLAAVSDHVLTLAAAAVALAFLAGSYGHVIGSRTLVLAAILTIAAICLFFVASGEIQTFG